MPGPDPRKTKEGKDAKRAKWDLNNDGQVTKKDILKARKVPGFKCGGKVKKRKMKGKK